VFALEYWQDLLKKSPISPIVSSQGCFFFTYAAAWELYLILRLSIKMANVYNFCLQYLSKESGSLKYSFDKMVTKLHQGVDKVKSLKDNNLSIKLSPKAVYRSSQTSVWANNKWFVYRKQLCWRLQLHMVNTLGVQRSWPLCRHRWCPQYSWSLPSSWTEPLWYPYRHRMTETYTYKRQPRKIK
jgi:hypothetical protein